MYGGLIFESGVSVEGKLSTVEDSVEPNVGIELRHGRGSCHMKMSGLLVASGSHSLMEDLKFCISCEGLVALMGP